MPERRRGGGRGRRRPSANAGRSYSRVDRVGRAVSEVVADELELIGDERLDLVTVTGATIEPGMSHAVVWYSALLSTDPEAAAAALGEHRVRLQRALGRQLRLRRTPELAFQSDPAIEKGTRVEEILRGLHHEHGDAENSGDAERLDDENAGG